MCIAVVVPAGLIVDHKIIHHCMLGNPAGNGFAYINKKGKVEIVRSADFTLKGKQNFIKQYQTLAASKAASKHPHLLHFRAATQGRISEENCHPFRVKDGVMIHNGTFFYSKDGLDARHSDSSIFAERYGKHLDYEFVHQHKDALDKAIGGYNKLAFLYDGGHTVIIKEEAWSKSEEGIMFSNSGWIKRG